MISSKDFNWKENKLYLGNKDTGFSVARANYISVDGVEYPGLYWVRWPDGHNSDDYYNLTRAKDHCISVALTEINGTERATEKAVDAFK